MSRYVQRDRDGTLIGHFANPQPGYAEEEVLDDHPDILAWQAARAAFRMADHKSSSNERLRAAEARLSVLEANFEVLRAQLSTQLAAEQLLARLEELEKRGYYVVRRCSME